MTHHAPQPARRPLLLAALWMLTTLCLTAFATQPVTAQPVTAQPVTGDHLADLPQRIESLLAAQRLDQAEALLRQLLARQNDAAAQDLLGVVLSRQGRLDEAEQAFRAALDAEPGLASAHQHMARLRLLQGRREEALAALRQAAQRGPLEKDLALTLAAAERASGRFDDAEAQWRSVAERFDSAAALLDIGRLRLAQRDAEGALEALGQALDLAPSSEEALQLYAQAALAGGRYRTAILTLEPLVRMHDDVGQYAYWLGLARLQIGDLQKAAEALEQAQRLTPAHAPTHIALGTAYNNQKRFDLAKPVLQRALRLAPDHVEALAALAEAEEGLSELESAEEYARLALTKSPQHVTANLVLGLIRMREQRYEEATLALQNVVRLDPASSKAHYQLSLAYARLGDRDASAHHLERYQAALEAFTSRQALASETSDASGENP